MKRVAYLCSIYPALSHTFIFREICSLRQEGIEVVTASVNPPPQVDIMTEAEQKEAAETMVMKTLSPLKILSAHLKCFLRSPAGYLRMAFTAVSYLFKGPKSPVKALGYLIEAGILMDWMRENDVEHIHEHFGDSTVLVAMLGKQYGTVRYSFSVHGPDIFYGVESNLLKEKIEGATFVRSISHYCSSQLMRLTSHDLWSNFHIIRCGIDPTVYTGRPLPGNDVIQLLCVGRLVPAKGQHILIEACSQLLKRGKRLHLNFVGGGQDLESLQQLSQNLLMTDSVTFAGSMGQDKVRSYYDRADIFVLPSFAEGVPVVLMEAMAKEIPVISTRITGIPELIEHGHDGLLATPGDVNDLAAQISTLLEDADLRERLGKAGRLKVKQLYNTEKNNRALADIFKQLP
ncbi:glycosyltransferase family 4 protein [Desulfogranum japonicum]|uniref:glycosyltransferase family 4 protein n=1 Tax=Desulfogranum japonicum TaxID=231447 RepID=UPI0003F5C6DF|nr:glycosyltransferase family 4 protein [Desulfogranum japonicum]